MTTPVDYIVKKHIDWLNAEGITEDMQQNLTSVEEVKFFTGTLKNSKAPLLDGIKFESSWTGWNKLHYIDKYFWTNTFYTLITQIFNWYLSNGYFPKTFKIGKVIPILKLGKEAKSPTSYRPISMLNCS